MTNEEWQKFLVWVTYTYISCKGEYFNWMMGCMELLSEYPFSADEKAIYVMDAQKVVEKTFCYGCCFESGSRDWYGR